MFSSCLNYDYIYLARVHLGRRQSLYSFEFNSIFLRAESSICTMEETMIRIDDDRGSSTGALAQIRYEAFHQVPGHYSPLNDFWDQNKAIRNSQFGFFSSIGKGDCPIVSFLFVTVRSFALVLFCAQDSFSNNRYGLRETILVSSTET